MENRLKKKVCDFPDKKRSRKSSNEQSNVDSSEETGSVMKEKLKYDQIPHSLDDIQLPDNMPSEVITFKSPVSEKVEPCDTTDTCGPKDDETAETQPDVLSENLKETVSDEKIDYSDNKVEEKEAKLEKLDNWKELNKTEDLTKERLETLPSNDSSETDAKEESTGDKTNRRDSSDRTSNERKSEGKHFSSENSSPERKRKSRDMSKDKSNAKDSTEGRDTSEERKGPRINIYRPDPSSTPYNEERGRSRSCSTYLGNLKRTHLRSSSIEKCLNVHIVSKLEYNSLRECHSGEKFMINTILSQESINNSVGEGLYPDVIEESLGLVKSSNVSQPCFEITFETEKNGQKSLEQKVRVVKDEIHIKKKSSKKVKSENGEIKPNKEIKIKEEESVEDKNPKKDKKNKDIVSNTLKKEEKGDKERKHKKEEQKSRKEPYRKDDTKITKDEERDQYRRDKKNSSKEDSHKKPKKEEKKSNVEPCNTKRKKDDDKRINVEILSKHKKEEKKASVEVSDPKQKKEGRTNKADDVFVKPRDVKSKIRRHENSKKQKKEENINNYNPKKDNKHENKIEKEEIATNSEHLHIINHQDKENKRENDLEYSESAKLIETMKFPVMCNSINTPSDSQEMDFSSLYWVNNTNIKDLNNLDIGILIDALESGSVDPHIMDMYNNLFPGFGMEQEPLLWPLITPDTPRVGIRGLNNIDGDTCWFNSVLQALNCLQPVQNFVINGHHRDFHYELRHINGIFPPLASLIRNIWTHNTEWVLNGDDIRARVNHEIPVLAGEGRHHVASAIDLILRALEREIRLFRSPPLTTQIMNTLRNWLRLQPAPLARNRNFIRSVFGGDLLETRECATCGEQVQRRQRRFKVWYTFIHTEEPVSIVDLYNRSTLWRVVPGVRCRFCRNTSIRRRVEILRVGEVFLLAVMRLNQDAEGNVINVEAPVTTPRGIRVTIGTQNYDYDLSSMIQTTDAVGNMAHVVTFANQSGRWFIMSDRLFEEVTFDQIPLEKTVLVVYVRQDVTQPNN